VSEPSAKLVRVKDGAMVAGVLAGVARYLGWDVTMVRIVFVVCSLLSAAFPGIVVYLILWILMPKS
jgi:phage shock protein PspC (stress-responsive transcriptional regulator)